MNKKIILECFSRLLWESWYFVVEANGYYSMIFMKAVDKCYSILMEQDCSHVVTEALKATKGTIKDGELRYKKAAMSVISLPLKKIKDIV